MQKIVKVNFMPVNIATAEKNATVTLDVVEGLDLGMAQEVQKLLAPIYEQFPFLSKMVWDVPIANLMAAILVFFLFLGFRKLFTTIIIIPLQQLAKKTETYYDDKIISALKGPLRFSFIIIGVHLFFVLTFKETDFIKNILSSLVVYTVFWAILDIVEKFRGVFSKVFERVNPDLGSEIGSFIVTIVKMLLIGIGLGAILQVWGINVTALVASLGIGGLAFALAAKDTAANLFGSFSLLADKSIRIGEWIKVNGVEGIVEDIGIRTTKIRTFDKSIITVPNHMIANNPIENFSRRGVRRIKMAVGLTYGTRRETIQTIVKEIREMLQVHEGIAQKETLLVHFDTFGDSSLNVFIYTFTATSNWAHYLETREDIHLKIMEIVERNGSGFAFPSQSIYLESLPKIKVEQDSMV